MVTATAVSDKLEPAHTISNSMELNYRKLLPNHIMEIRKSPPKKVKDLESPSCRAWADKRR